jgi:hypothetical protein
MNLGVLLVINFTDLTIGMLMIHLFTYDPSWFRLQTGIALQVLRLPIATKTIPPTRQIPLTTGGKLIP